MTVLPEKVGQVDPTLNTENTQTLSIKTPVISTKAPIDTMDNGTKFISTMHQKPVVLQTIGVQNSSSSESVEQSIGSSSNSIIKPNLKEKEKSLLDIKFNFSEPTDVSNSLDLAKGRKEVQELDDQETFFESLDDLRMEVTYNSTHEFELSLAGTSNTELTCSTEFHKKWPIPETIEQVHQLCEAELLDGTPQSKLALCLHLMESASQVDPNNNTVLSPDETKNGSGMLEDILSSFKNVTTPATLGEAMIFESKKLLKQLAEGGQNLGEGGEAEAQFLLGNCYGMGALGWPIDPKLAFLWYSQASKYNHAEASYRTAVCYEMGIGTAKDGNRAIVFYRKAAFLAHVPSMYKLGVILLRGYCGQPVSKREAVIWLQRAVTTAMSLAQPNEKGKSNAISAIGQGGMALPHALHALAIIQLSKECEGTSMLPDPNYAIKLLHKAANLGYAPSQSKLAECYECGHHCEEDEAKSIYWYTLAAQQDYPEACLALSGWYLTGSIKTDTIQQSDEEAFLWAQKAARLAKTLQLKSVQAKAYYALGIYYENGIGIDQSVETATKWYKKAAQYGHKEALKKNLN